jgi:hypothetical protein
MHMEIIRRTALVGGLAMAWTAGSAMAGGAGGRADGDAGGVPPCAGSSDDPCDLGLERRCIEASSTGGATLPSPFCGCTCGTGFWVQEVTTASAKPAEPFEESRDDERINGTTWWWRRSSEAQPWFAEASVLGRGISEFWHAGSLTKSATARFATTERERWIGSGVPCPRLVQLAAVGGGMLEITLTCSAQAGCAATASASIAGMCASRGDANAAIEGKTVDGNVAYRSLTHTTAVEGRLGASVDDDSVGIDGKISEQRKWEVSGAGTASGSASYTVRPDRTYCAFTNRPITRTASGSAVAVGGGTVDWNGSIAFEAMAVVAMRVQ